MDTVSSKAQVMGLLRRADHRLRAFGVVRIGLFGSFVRDEAMADSDVDLMVEFHPEHKTLKNLVGLSTYLKEALGREVEVVTPQSLSPFLAPHILKEVEYVPLTD
jgi:predicted nucleotidyltransferase